VPSYQVRVPSASDMQILCNLPVSIVTVFMLQARPSDYAEGYLSNQLAVTFHRHWMIDPIDVYHQWLTDRQTVQHQDL